MENISIFSLLARWSIRTFLYSKHFLLLYLRENAFQGKKKSTPLTDSVSFSQLERLLVIN